MASSYAELSHIDLQPGTSFRRPPEVPKPYRLDSPALEFMTDFHAVEPITVNPQTSIDDALEPQTAQRLEEIPGIVPSLRREIVGCPFAPRCKFAKDHCRRESPPLEEHATDHWTSCWEIDQVRSTLHG